jgi:hypothetical protein
VFLKGASVRQKTNIQLRDKRCGEGLRSRYKKLSPHILATERYLVVPRNHPPRIYFTLRQAVDVAEAILSQHGGPVPVVQETREPGTDRWRQEFIINKNVA